MRRGRRSGCFTIVAVHSTARGPALGGCRMWHYDDSRAAMRDALRLSQAMTLKSAVAGLPLGGGKAIIMAPDPTAARAARLARRRAARPRRDGRAARRQLRHGRGRRHVVARHGGHLVDDEPRERPLAAARRLGRPEPVDGARRRGGDPRLLRARLRNAVAGSSRTIAIAGLGNVGGRVATACAQGRRDAARDRHRPAQARARRRARRALAGARRGDRGAGRRLRAVRARRRCSTTTASRGSALRSSPARRTTSSPTTTSPRCSPSAASCGRRTSSSTPAGSSTSPSSSSRGGYDAAPRGQARARDRRHAAADLRRRAGALRHPADGRDGLARARLTEAA